MRTERLFRHGSPALQAAFAQGTISLYRAGEIAKLPANQQELVVAQWTARSLIRTEGQRIATTVIRGFLNGSGSQKKPISLAVLSSAIRDTIRET
jgi:hypothetical protein